MKGVRHMATAGQHRGSSKEDGQALRFVSNDSWFLADALVTASVHGAASLLKSGASRGCFQGHTWLSALRRIRMPCPQPRTPFCRIPTAHYCWQRHQQHSNGQPEAVCADVL